MEKKTGQKLVVRTSNSTRPVLELMLPLFEQETGIAIELIVLSSKVARERIEAGERGDVAILQDVAIDALTASGILDISSAQNFADSPIGLGCLDGQPKPDISTLKRFAQVLLGCQSIAHTQFGPSGRYFPELAREMGIADEMHAKAVTRPGGYIGRVVVEGAAELAFQQICELIAVPGITVIGPIPGEVQRNIVSKAAAFSESAMRKAAQSLLDFIARTEHAAIFQQTGLEPPTRI